MRILVLGGDGYLGWPTALHLSARGHDVAVLDSFARRGYDEELGTQSLIQIAALDGRVERWTAESGHTIGVYVGDLTDGPFVHQTLADFAPDAVVHFAEQRSSGQATRGVTSSGHHAWSLSSSPNRRECRPKRRVRSSPCK